MTDRVTKQRVMTLLRRAGLWGEAEEYREEVRQRLRAEGKTKQEAVAAAWREMEGKYKSLAEKATAPTSESSASTPHRVPLPGTVPIFAEPKAEQKWDCPLHRPTSSSSPKPT